MNQTTHTCSIYTDSMSVCAEVALHLPSKTNGCIQRNNVTIVYSSTTLAQPWMRETLQIMRPTVSGWLVSDINVISCFFQVFPRFPFRGSPWGAWARARQSMSLLSAFATIPLKSTKLMIGGRRMMFRRSIQNSDFGWLTAFIRWSGFFMC